MLTHYNLIVEMTERRRELERLMYANGLVNRRMCNHIYRHLAGWRDRSSLRSKRLKLESAVIES